MGHFKTKALTMDFLHVFLKGLVEQMLAAILNLITLVSGLASINHDLKNAASHLDELMRSFIFHQTYFLSRHVRWPNGISVHAEKMGKVLIGGLESWKILSLFVHVYFSIGQDGKILPNTTQWWKACVIDKLTNQTFLGELSVNLSKCVLSAMGAVLEVAFLIMAPTVKSTYMADYSLLMANCRVHQQRLCDLRCRMLDIPAARIGGYKMHGLTHFPSDSQQHGHDRRYKCTCKGESCHPLHKICFECTAKKDSVSKVHMAANFIERERAGRLLATIPEVDGRPPYAIPEKAELIEGQRAGISLKVLYRFSPDQCHAQSLTNEAIDLAGGQLKLRVVLQTFAKRKRKFVRISGGKETNDEACELVNPKDDLRNKPTIHPFIPLVSLEALLKEYELRETTNEQSKHLLNSGFKNTAKILLHRNFLYQGGVINNTRDFQIRANILQPFDDNNRDGVDPIQSFSFLNVAFIEQHGDGEDPSLIPTLVRVMAIVQIVEIDKEEKKVTLDLLVVALLKKKNRTLNDYYPYDKYGYHSDKSSRTSYSLHVLDLATTKIEPAFVMPTKGCSSKYKSKAYTGGQISDETFWFIPVDRGRGMKPLTYKALNQQYPDTFLSVDDINAYAETVDENANKKHLNAVTAAKERAKTKRDELARAKKQKGVIVSLSSNKDDQLVDDDEILTDEEAELLLELDEEEPGNGERELSDYEKLREDNIRRNMERLRELGFAN